MPTITIPITSDLKKEIDSTTSVNWKKVAGKALRAKAAQLRLFKGIVSESRLTAKEANALGEKINAAMHARLHPQKVAQIRRRMAALEKANQDPEFRKAAKEFIKIHTL